MKPVCLLSALFFFSLRAQAPVPVPLAHGDVPGEPHHHLKIENTYVRAYYVEVPAHGETQLHQHDHDYLYVALGASNITNAVLGLPEVNAQLKDGDIRFVRAGFAHVARNNGDVAFRNVTTELLQPQGKIRNLCRRIVDGPLADCEHANLQFNTSIFASVALFETQSVRVEVIEFKDRQVPVGFRRSAPQLLVAMEGAFLKVKVGGQPYLPLRAGDALWLPADVSYDIRADAGFVKAARCLVLTFADPAKLSPSKPR